MRHIWQKYLMKLLVKGAYRSKLHNWTCLYDI